LCRLDRYFIRGDRGVDNMESQVVMQVSDGIRTSSRYLETEYVPMSRQNSEARDYQQEEKEFSIDGARLGSGS
jgi:hypothetical protein